MRCTERTKALVHMCEKSIVECEVGVKVLLTCTQIKMSDIHNTLC